MDASEFEEKRFDEIRLLAHSKRLDPFPISFERVTREIIWDTASYGLPTRMSHWSFGKSFLHQKVYGEMGFSKIYELIINSNPSLALLDLTNSPVANLLICAHCYGHSDFFKNNLLFAPTNRNMVNQAEQNAKVIDAFKDKYGIDTVEDWMDIAFSIDNHIDWNRGEIREKYPPPEHVFKVRQPLPYADLFGEDDRPQVVEEIKNLGFPPYLEKDLLWFLINYAQMLPWQREVFNLIRSEAFYFYPQGQTKIINEGWASFWHAELMLEYDNMTAEEHLEFAKAHASVVRPGGGGSLNPYYVGFRILTDIRERWDEYYKEGQKDKAFLASDDLEKRDDNGKIVMSKMDGMDKLFEVRTQEDDISFIGNYLTRDLCEDMELFTYGLEGAYEDPQDDDVILKDRELDIVKRTMVERLYNNGVPPIGIISADESGLYLVHDERDKMTLEPTYAKKTLEYIYAVWKRPVILKTHDEKGGEVIYEAGKEGVTEEFRPVNGGKTKRLQI